MFCSKDLEDSARFKSRPGRRISWLRVSWFSSAPLGKYEENIPIKSQPLHPRISSTSKSKSHCDWRSVSKSWCRAPSGTHDQIFNYYYLTVTVLFLWGALFYFIIRLPSYIWTQSSHWECRKTAHKRNILSKATGRKTKATEFCCLSTIFTADLIRD
jgi:hypothetical protein